MSETTERKQRTIPEFASREEEAEFWDTHDIADYWDELEPVEVKFSQKVNHGVIVIFESETFDKLFEMADERGVFPDALIHDWVAKGMKEAQATAPDSLNPAASSAE
ncbi:MAG: CopG family antitoxin [Dehalococcoidia bacterium]|nr:CopG family antitoxin [Dehalococcoidia bacterium]